MRTRELKQWCGVLLLGVACATARGQGTITFANGGPGWSAPWYGYGSNNSVMQIWVGGFDSGSWYVGQNLLAGTGYTAELWAGPEGSGQDQLQPLGRATFRTGAAAGQLVPLPAGTVAVPFATPGQRVTIQVRVWDNNFGSVTSWASALNNQFLRPCNASELFLTPPLQSGAPVTLEGMNSYLLFIDSTVPQRLPVISLNMGGTTNYGNFPWGTNSPRSVVQGETVTLGVECPPPGAQVQWSFAGVNITSGTNRTLILSNIQPAQAGLYTAVATTNLVASRVARMTNSITVTVTGSLRLSNPQASALNASSNKFAATITGVTNRYVAIESSSNLQTWTTQKQVFVGIYDGPPGRFTNYSFTGLVPVTNHQFYRARIVP